MFLEGTALALLLAGICCVLYLGLEPVVRRRIPYALISWSRLTAGRWRDPLVGRDVAYGFAAAGVLNVVVAALAAGAQALAAAPVVPGNANFQAAVGVFPFVGQIASALVGVLISPMLILLLVAVLNGLFRSLAAALAVAFLIIGPLAAGQSISASGSVVLGTIGGLSAVGVMLFVVKRFGLLSLMAFTLPSLVLSSIPATLDPSEWFFGYSAAAMVLLVATALFAVRAATAPAR